MPDMKSTSASVYGSRPSPGGVAWRPRAGAPAHAAVATARSRYATFVARDGILFSSARDILSLASFEGCGPSLVRFTVLSGIAHRVLSFGREFGRHEQRPRAT